MKFEISHTFDASLTTVLDAMFDDGLPAFLTEKMSTIIEIETLSKDVTDSSITRKVRYRPEPLIKKIGPKTVPPRWMEWIEESTFNRGRNSLTFKNIPTTAKIASLMHNEGTMTLSESGGRTIRVVKGELKIKVFLLGKIAEKFIFKQARSILDEEARSLNQFIAQR